MAEKKKGTTKPAATSGTVISVDFTGVESGGGRIRVPEGDYGLKIKKVEHKKGEDSGKPYLNFTFEITKGDKKGIGKSLPHSCSLQKQALWNLRNLLEACGKQVPAKALKIDTAKLVGLTCAGTISDDEYEGKKKSVIAALFPLADLGKTSDSGDELESAGEESEETEESTEEESSEEETEEASDEEESLFN